MNLAEKLETLFMTPPDWTILNQSVTPDEYREIVMRYQEKEFSRLPRCESLFGLCRHYTCGHCTEEGYCRFKRKVRNFD